MAPIKPADLTVTLVYSPVARHVEEFTLQVHGGTTVGQAIEHSTMLARIPAEMVAQLELGIWGRKVALSHVLRDLDRIEIYRPLTVDPKVARRERFTRQGAKSAGLFTKRRAGAKAGY